MMLKRFVDNSAILFHNAADGRGGRNEYDASKTSNKRKSAPSKLTSEDEQLTRLQRKQLLSNARTQRQNLSLIAWMVRQHVKYVSDFQFHAQTDVEEVDKALENLVEWHGKRRNFDVAKRHSRKRSLRLFETCKVVDGDCAYIKLGVGNLQAIESDRICVPNKGGVSNLHQFKAYDSKTGLKLNRFGAVEKYCVCKRDGSCFVYDHVEPAENVIFSGYFGRFDQSRGISPLSTAIEQTAQLYSGWDWTLIKVKLHAMLGIAILRNATGENDGFNYNRKNATTSDETGDETTTTDESRYEMKLQDGLMKLELEPGDDVKLMESGTPNPEIIDWSELVMRVILLALDIPYTFIDSRKSSYSAGMMDRIEYERSAKEKQESNIEVLDEYTEWLLNYKGKNNELARRVESLMRLLRKNRMTLDDVRYEWVPAGFPWFDKLKEVNGDVLAVGAGFDSRQRVCKRHGVDFFKIVDELSKEINYAKSKNVLLTTGQPGQALTDSNENNENDGESDEKTDESEKLDNAIMKNTKYRNAGG